MKADNIIEEFLDELSIDIDFDANSRQFEVKTEEFSGEEHQLPTVQQLMNKNTQELLQAIIVDINPFFEIDIDDVSDFTDTETFNIEIHLKGINTYVDVMRELIGTGSLETTKDTAEKFEQLLEELNFNIRPGKLTTKRVDALEDITKIVAHFENFFKSHEKVTSFDDLNESKSIITKFSKFK